LEFWENKGATMIQNNDAVKLEDGTILAKHKVEILCPNCSRDVDEAELAAQKCNDCGHSLSAPKQNVAINVTSKPIGTKIWGQ
jgi:Zn finger protein HypA/HybF involved in hydrogenase expression